MTDAIFEKIWQYRGTPFTIERVDNLYDGYNLYDRRWLDGSWSGIKATESEWKFLFNLNQNEYIDTGWLKSDIEAFKLYRQL